MGDHGWVMSGRRWLRPLIEERLRERGCSSLAVLVAAGRRDGDSWARIAADVERLSGVGVSDQTLINWFTEGTS